MQPSSFNPIVHDLRDVAAGEGTSITQALVDRIAAAVEDGSAAPGARLPPVRALADAAGVNHLTAARAYRRLAELGYVTAAVGRGTFVRARPVGAAERHAADGGAESDWQLAALPAPDRSYASDVLEASMRHGADAIRLGNGFPAPELCPAQELAALARAVLRDDPGAHLAYQASEGLLELRERLAELGRRAGFASSSDEIVITTGARQAIDVVARTLLEPGASVAVESPTFTGTLASLEATGARVLGIGVDEDGLDVAALERVLARHEITAVFLQPAAQNPMGVDLSAPRRARLLELARDRGFFVVEDGVYATMRFDAGEAKRLREGAPAHVVYVDSLSKSLGGGLRVGWIAAQGPVLARLRRTKMNTDLHSPVLGQMVAARWLEGGRHVRHLKRVVPVYRERRDRLLAALERHLGDEATWRAPGAGHNVWLTLHRPIDERLLLVEAKRSGVTLVPGGATQAGEPARRGLRLAFSFEDPERFDEGARRLAAALRQARRVEGDLLEATPS